MRPGGVDVADRGPGPLTCQGAGRIPSRPGALQLGAGDQGGPAGRSDQRAGAVPDPTFLLE
jgi:hypothetical protein